MSTERDTHFSGFARLLQQEIWETECSIVPMLTSGYQTSQVAKTLAEAVRTLIAQRAYDLALHILICDATENLNWIPDLTEWPTLPTSVPASPAPD